METQNLIEILRSTMNTNHECRMAAERELNKMRKTIGFGPTILQIVMEATVELPARLAGAVFLKHLIEKSWSDPKTVPDNSFSIYEQDRDIIRGALMDALVHAPDIIRVQLSMCMNHIITNDFPLRWPHVVGHIGLYLQSQDINASNGALVTMYQLVKIYEYKLRERMPMYEAMHLLLPMTYQLIVRLLDDQSEQSVLLQKQILKIYYSLTRYSLPLAFITKETFSQWMEICRRIAVSDVPDCSHLDDDSRTEFPYWKTKKWALHILVNMFTRYGSPHKVVSSEYTHFAEWYLPTFSQGVLEALIGILSQYRNQVYVSPRVLTDVLYYLKRAVCHSYTWRLINPYVDSIIQDVIFTIMSFSDSDQRLWDSDPNEYIRLKFETIEDYASLVPAAQGLLLSMCKKRQGILSKVLNIIIQVITDPDADNKRKEGGLHMIGTLAEILLKKASYCAQMETILTTFVLPEFQNPAGHLRARVCWVMNSFCEIQIRNPDVLAKIMRQTLIALLTDKELPVKVQAAVSLQMYLSYQEEAGQYVVGQIKEICREMLIVIRDSENENLTSVMQGIVSIFPEQISPVATEICQHLAVTLSKVLESEDVDNEKTRTAWSLLSTFETLLDVMQLHPDILLNMQHIVTNVVGHIFLNNLNEFYEVTFELVVALTNRTISPEMWQMLEMIYQLFKEKCGQYFANIMPALYNYVTVDTPAFLSNPNRLLGVLDMCQTVLTSSPGDNPEWFAAKLLEVIILQCMGQIDEVIPTVVQLALFRLMRGVQTPELRSICLEVGIAALYYNPQLLLSILDKMSQQTSIPISAHFIEQWLYAIECFQGIHDRKLCILGLCTLISLEDAKPQVLSEMAAKIMPAFILLFDGLKRAYALRDEEENDEDDDSDGWQEALGSEEDDMDEMGSEESSDEEMEPDSDFFFTSIDDAKNKVAIDEYCMFKDVFIALSVRDHAWYTLLTSNLTPEQSNALQEVVVTADHRKAAKMSKLAQKNSLEKPTPTNQHLP